MTDKYSHRERLQHVLNGQEPDRFAASFWRHFYHKEHFAEGTAEAMLDFQKRFDWDFMKINPRADYHIEGWGFRQKYSHDEFVKHTKTNFPIKRLEDWRDIEPLKLSTLSLDEHLRVVSIIRKKVGPDLPVLMTVFTPLAIARRMVEDDALLASHIHEHPEAVVPALEAITQTFEQFVVELRNAGADGIFFATTQWGSSNLISWAEYERFGVPFDLRVIRAAGDDALNLLHICSSNNFLKQIGKLDYPYALLNWDSEHPTNLPLDKGVTFFEDKTVVGGVDHEGWLLKSSADEIRYKMGMLKEKLDRSRVIIGPGCSIPPEVPLANLQVIRESL